MRKIEKQQASLLDKVLLEQKVNDVQIFNDVQEQSVIIAYGDKDEDLQSVNSTYVSQLEAAPPT